MNENVQDLGEAAMAYMEGYVAGFDRRKGFVKSNIFRVRFSWAPAEYCVSVKHVLRNLLLCMPLLHELTLSTTRLYKSRDAAHNSSLVQCPNLNHASSWAI